MPARPHSHILAAIVEQHNWTRGAEIGVFRGDTLFYLLDCFPTLHMIGVDQWLVLPDGRYERHKMPEIGSMVRARAKTYPDRCEILYMDSMKAAEEVPDKSLDFIFIDGDHTHEGATADIQAWTPKVRAGGYITGHDYDYETVAAALDDLLPGWIKHDKMVWSVPKPDA